MGKESFILWDIMLEILKPQSDRAKTVIADLYINNSWNNKSVSICSIETLIRFMFSYFKTRKNLQRMFQCLAWIPASFVYIRVSQNTHDKYFLISTPVKTES